MKLHTPNLIVVSALLMLAVPAAAQEAPFATAQKHAGLAVASKTLPDVTMHLHHVLNCLEGPSGPNFDPKPGDPCGGKGGLDALPAGSADRAQAQKAIDLAKEGLAKKDFKAAHDSAQAVQAALGEHPKG